MFRGVAARLKAAASAAGVFTGITDGAGNRYPIPYAVSKSSIPVGIPPSSTVNNNGAFIAGNSAPLAYTGGIYLYFPANALFSGSAAGLYWTVMSTVLLGTIYANTYTSGEPTVPAVLTPIVATGPGAFAQTIATDITVRSNLIPAGTFTKLRTTIQLSGPNNANAKFCRLMLGGQTYGGANISLAGNAAAETFRIIAARGSNLQVAWGTSQITVGGGGSIQQFNADTSADVNHVLTLNIATATDWYVMEGALLEMFP